jgi:hypothetical protein
MLQPIWAALKNAINSVIADAPKHVAHEVVDHINERRHIKEREAKAKADLVKAATGPSKAGR